MTEPMAEKVLAAIADVLSDLSGIRPGDWMYPRTPTVDRAIPLPGDQMASASLPRLYVVPGSGSRLVALDAAGDPQVYRHELRVDIHGLVEADAFALADTWRWRLRRDVLETLHLHLSLGGLAQRIEFGRSPGSEGTDDVREAVDAGETAPKAWFLQPLTVWLLDEYPTGA